MGERFATLKEVDVTNKHVLVRVDFNVPLDRKKNIADDRRMRASLPTILYLMKKKAYIVLVTHLGRPQGIDPSLKTDVLAFHLSKLIKKKVIKVSDCIGSDVEKTLSRMKPGDVALLENLRFYPEEGKNSENFSRGLARLADVYVNDSFATCHRMHASVVGITKHLPSCAGFLLEKELELLSKGFSPKHPFVVVLGGAKVSDKIGMVNHLAQKADTLLIGGAMAFTFFRALGVRTGKSVVEEHEVMKAKELLAAYKNKIVLPRDIVVGVSRDDTKGEVVDVRSIPDNKMGLDIGPETARVYAEVIKSAKTVLWNGPMGLFENKAFLKGSDVVARAIAANKGITLAGGGDTVELIDLLKLGKKYTHVSTGGGATLAFFEGKPLVGVQALMDNTKIFSI